MASGYSYTRSRRYAPIGVAALTGISGNLPPDYVETFLRITHRSGNRAYKINGQYTCEDARRRTIWCVHRLAVKIHKRATALLKGAPHANVQKPPNDASEPTATLSGTDQNDQSPAPLPVESFPPSTCRITDTIGTREICWTLRGEDEAVGHRVQRVLTFLDKLKAAGPSLLETSE